MANTLNLGNGNWATKKDSLLAYNSENGNFKPLPFSFSRASNATVVNEQGLIELVGSDEPRIDFKDDAKGSLLLEPTRSNLVTYSEDFSQGYWTKLNTSISSGFISPNGGVNSFKLIENTSSGDHRIDAQGITTSSGLKYTLSMFLKKDGDREWFKLRDFTTNAYVNVNLSNGTIGATNLANSTQNSEYYGNGWYRVSFTFTASSSVNLRLYIGVGDNNTSYLGNGSNGVLMYGVQLEQGSYPTSYIPTNGSAVTRVGDACNNGGNEQVFNDNEGVLMVEMSAIADDLTNRRITISDNSTNNRVVLGFSDASNSILALVGSSGTQFIATIAISDIKLNNKFALKYKENDFALWVNGIEIATDTSGNTPVGLSTLKIQGSTGFSNFYGNVKDVRVYNTALTNAELQALTTI